MTLLEEVVPSLRASAAEIDGLQDGRQHGVATPSNTED